MGRVLSEYEYKSYGSAGMLKPIIFCYPADAISQQAVSLNVKLAQELIKLKPARRRREITRIFNTLIAEMPDGSIIKDFEVLFSPSLQLDILSFLIDACRRKNFAVVWPGTYHNGRLVYAEPGCTDFKAYDIEKYDVTCIVK